VVLALLVDVAARRERPVAGAGDHDAANLVVDAHARDGLVQLGVQPLVHRVQLLRPVHGDDPDPFRSLDEDMVCHDLLPQSGLVATCGVAYAGWPGTRRGSMDYGLFTMPSHPPERGLNDGHQWDLQQLRWADALGFSEAWIGEHHTAPCEPHPSPDLLVTQALMQTKNMRIGPGGFLMPYHHPAELANRVAMLDHMAQGRLNFGGAASGLPSDLAMFNVDGNAGQHREMTRESLDIILRLWSDEPEFDHKGKYWHVTKTGTMIDTLKPHIAPLQKPHPPIGVAGVSNGSDTLKLAGERGFWPMSLNLNPAYVASHWESVEIGAARSGRTPRKRDWRLVREIFVADTDAEAMRLSAGGMMGRQMREYF